MQKAGFLTTRLIYFHTIFFLTFWKLLNEPGYPQFVPGANLAFMYSSTSHRLPFGTYYQINTIHNYFLPNSKNIIIGFIFFSLLAHSNASDGKTYNCQLQCTRTWHIFTFLSFQIIFLLKLVFITTFIQAHFLGLA